MRVFIDVREPYEYVTGHVEGAVNIPPAKLMTGEGLENIPKDTEIIVYCRTGSRSNVAIHLLKQRGYEHLINGINQQQVEAKYL